MFTKLPCLAVVSALLCSSVSAVTLNDFTPRIPNLTGDCQKIYTSNINNCQPSDFAKGQCSVACVSSLHAIGDSVRKACSGQGSSGNIIAAFQNGQGANQLCPRPVSAASNAASKSATIGSSTMVLSSTNAPSTGLILDTSSTPAKSSVSSKAPTGSSSRSVVTAISTATILPTPEAMSTTSTVGSTLAFDTHTPSDVPTSSTKTHAAKHTSSSEGGSPFDSAEGAASGIATSAAMLMSAVVACLLVLL